MSHILLSYDSPTPPVYLLVKSHLESRQQSGSRKKKNISYHPSPGRVFLLMVRLSYLTSHSYDVFYVLWTKISLRQSVLWVPTCEVYKRLSSNLEKNKCNYMAWLVGVHVLDPHICQHKHMPNNFLIQIKDILPNVRMLDITQLWWNSLHSFLHLRTDEENSFILLRTSNNTLYPLLCLPITHWE